MACIVARHCSHGTLHQADIEDNEFAEFEDFDEDDDDEEVVFKEETSEKPKQAAASSTPPPSTMEKLSDLDADEATVEDEEEDEDDTEFEHLQDDEEFEGFDQGKPGSKAKGEAADIKITKVPIHLRTNWDSFYLEMLMIAGLAVYFLNFITGKNKNQKLANAWLSSHRQLLEQNFSLIGDDGKSPENDNPGLVKESEHIYTLWCSGRTCCEGMLVELKFFKRQDLIQVIAQLLRPNPDQIIIKVNMNPDDMDSFVFAIANKKTAVKLSKEMADISTFCPEKKNLEKHGLPSSFVMFNELGEVPAKLLDPKVVEVMNKFEDLIDYIHFSDQYSGLKMLDDSQPSKMPDVTKVLIFAFNVPGSGHSSPEGMESMKPLLQLVFHSMEKVKRFKLGKEAKQKAEKTRLRIEEAFLKTTHQQREEAAKQRRDEKRRAEKERIMNEEDPDKQRRWEEKERRREMKKRAPKMKQLKVKAL